MTLTNGTIGRKRKKNGFTQIANSMFEDDRLSWRAKGILGYLLSRPNNWKINKTDLYRRATEGRDAMQNALNELKDLNYLHIYPNQDKETGRLCGWIWEYDDTPFTREILNNGTTENEHEIGENDAFFSSSENENIGNVEVQQASAYNNTDLNNTNYNNTKVKKNNNIKINSAEIDREFEALWKLYPRKIGKQTAFKSFKKARKVEKVPYETIENGLYRYIEHLKSQGTDEQFIQHGSTWFNQAKWLDEYETAHFQKKPKLSSFSQNMLGHMDDPDDFLNMIGVGEVHEQERNRKIIDAH